MKTIIAIDGGGMNGLMPARWLEALERRLEAPIHECVDLLAGVSTGGILATALAFGVPAHRAARLYADRGPEIFRRPLTTKLRTLWGARADKYPARYLRRVLQDELGDWALSDAKTELLVTAWDQGDGCLVDGGMVSISTAHFAWAEARRLWPGEDLMVVSLACRPSGTGRSVFFKRHKARVDASRDEAAWRIAYATSAAPTFFPPMPTGRCDGHGGGLLGWGQRAADVFLYAGADEVDRLMVSVMEGRGYFRIAPDWAGGMDDTGPGNIARLEEAAQRMIDATEVELEEVAQRALGDE